MTRQQAKEIGLAIARSMFNRTKEGAKRMALEDFDGSYDYWHYVLPFPICFMTYEEAYKMAESYWANDDGYLQTEWGCRENYCEAYAESQTEHGKPHCPAFYEYLRERREERNCFQVYWEATWKPGKTYPSGGKGLIPSYWEWANRKFREYLQAIGKPFASRSSADWQAFWEAQAAALPGLRFHD